ncbi:hypothetical protein [Aeromonas sp. NJAU223]|uniref:hypothetical protein n=1 Tax=Aeromonas sp. NJAU223 TaxID=3115650 RepID=UPI003DAA3D8B
MDAQVVWLPIPLYTALIRMQMDDFTTIECVHAAFGDKGHKQTQRKRYGLIYRHLIKLVNMGLLERRNVDDVRLHPSFVKTPMFHGVIFQEEPSGPEAQEIQEPDVEASDALLDELEAKARLYRLKIQECQAAIAEYNKLQADFPALDMTIEHALNRSYGEFHGLRGKLGAVEAVMKELGEVGISGEM